jgi:signal transduction histidine kinase
MGDLARPPPTHSRHDGDVRERGRTPNLVPAFVILSIGLAGAFFLWRTIQRAQDLELETQSAAVAGLFAQVIEAQVAGHELDALRVWVSQSERYGAKASAAWQTDAELFLADHPAFGAVARIDSRGRASDSAGAAEAQSALRSLIPETLSPGQSLVGPTRLAGGRAALGVLVGSGPDPRPAVFALLEPEVPLRRLFGQGVAGYSVRVLSGNDELFRLPANGVAPPADPYWKTADVAVGATSSWTLLVHPTALLGGIAQRGGAILGLAACITISALLALLVLEAQLARARGVSLLRVDADLRESIAETEREVTEVRELRGALETRVTERTAVLRDTIEELETFNYSVAHDLRSPMGAVINFAGIIDHDFGTTLDPQAKEYLSRISASATGAVALMNGLLAFSQSGREPLHKRNIDVRDLVESVRDDLVDAKSHDAAAVEIGDLPEAFADPSMIRRVFTNLISNALKFARPGTHTHVEVAGYTQKHETVYFVRDDGVGFDMRYAQKLFGVFERLHSREEFEGHGVGLAIVSRLVRRHGGRIWAQGIVGKGATFFFSLPNRGSTEVEANGPPEV